MDDDFLDGIDEHLERLISEHGNGSNNRRNRRSNANGLESDHKVRAIVAGIEELSDTERDQVLDLIRSFKRHSEL